MTIFKFSITLEDVCQVKSYECSNTKGFRNLVFFERMIGMIIIVFTIYMFRDSLSRNPSFMLFLGICLVWVIWFPRMLKLHLKRYVKNEIRETGETSVDGEVTISFCENTIEQKSPNGMIRKISYSQVEQITDTGNYVLIYDRISPIPIILVSSEVFGTQENKEQFVENLQSQCEISIANR